MIGDVWRLCAKAATEITTLRAQLEAARAANAVEAVKDALLQDAYAEGRKDQAEEDDDTLTTLRAKVEALEKSPHPTRATEAILRDMAARGFTRPQIADELGYSEGYINRRMTRYGIRTSGRTGRKPAPKAAAPIRKNIANGLPAVLSTWFPSAGLNR